MSDRRLRSHNNGEAGKNSRSAADRDSGEITQKKSRNDRDSKFSSSSNELLNASDASSSSKVARTFDNNPLVSSMQFNGFIGGITVLDGDLYVVADVFIRVHHATTLAEKPYLRIAEMFNTVGLAGCCQSKTLYFIDSQLNCVLLLDLDTMIIHKWGLKKNYEPKGISVKSKQNILVTEFMHDASKDKNIILEFTPEGHPVSEIILDESMRLPFQAIKLPNEQFLVSHGDGNSKSYCRICIINSEGKIIKSFGKETGNRKNQLNWPSALAVDDNRDVIFLADQNNHRVLMFSKDLKHLGQVQINEILSHPSHLFFDSSSGRLFISHHSDRLLIISTEDK